jgi:hypothetical protein
MSKGGKQEVVEVGHNSYAGTRFNAVKHAVLSRYTVLPWEDATEYGELLEALVIEHKPEGPTETHLVEEIAGIFWRKRRLRLAEASTVREGLHRATRSYSDTGEAALVCVSGGTGDVGDALRATSEQTAEELRENREAQTAAEKALTILRAGKENAYQRALEALIPGTREWWLETLEEWAEEPEPEYEASVESLTGWLEEEAIPYFGKREAELTNRELIREHALGEALAAKAFEDLARYEVHLDRKLERTLAMLIKLQDLRRTSEPN